MDNLLDSENLVLDFSTPDGVVHALSGIDMSVRPAEFIGIVGESGSGKTQLLLSILGLIPNNGRLTGSIRYKGQELIGVNSRFTKSIRGNRVSMIFQDPMTSLNPYLTIGRQLTEVLVLHKGIRRRAASARAMEMLEAVQLPEPEHQLRQYPHELSGGMRQRVMIAMALICEPELILADEPTTALDVTVQAEILSLLSDLQKRYQTAVILVTHDLGVIAQVADRVLVMYAGRIVESGTSEDIFYSYQHPYTEGLHLSVPRLEGDVTKRLRAIPGSPPNLSELSSGCAFFPRCAYGSEKCQREFPDLKKINKHHKKACFYEKPLKP